MLADELGPVRSVLNLVLKQVTHFGPLQFLALLVERCWSLQCCLCVHFYYTWNKRKQKMSLTETYNQRSKRKECFITYAAWFLGPLIACKAVSSSASPSGLQREHRNVKGGLLELCCHRGKRFLIKVTLAARRRQVFDPTRFLSPLYNLLLHIVEKISVERMAWLPSCANPTAQFWF